jgi:hypothetical protein
MAITRNDVVVATHGRSFWILDDVTLLHQLSESVMEAPAYLFEPRTTVRFRAGARLSAGGGSPVAQNPPQGVIIHYYLKAKPAGEVALTILDTQGNVVGSFSSDGDTAVRIPKEKGANRFAWDMRYRGPTEVPGAIFKRYRPTGPLAVPGTYQVRLDVGGESLVQSFETVKDPRIKASMNDLKRQHELLMAIRDKISETHETIINIRKLRSEIAEGVKTGSDVKSAVDRLWEIEDELIQFRAKVPRDLNNYPTRLNDKFSSLAYLVERGDGAPTDQDFEAFEDFCARLDRQKAKLQEVIKTDLGTFDQSGSK